MIATLDTSLSSYSDTSCSNYYYTSGSSQNTTPDEIHILRYVDAYWSEDDMLRQIHAAQMRCRDLGFLYRELCKQNLLPAFHARRIIKQPCWSARRWRSLT